MVRARHGGLTETQVRMQQQPSATPEAYLREILLAGSSISRLCSALEDLHDHVPALR